MAGKSKKQKEVEDVVGPMPTEVTMHLDRDPNDERLVRVRKHKNHTSVSLDEEQAEAEKKAKGKE